MEEYLHTFIYIKHMTFNPAKRHLQLLQLRKFHPLTVHEGIEGVRGISVTCSLTLALDGGGWSVPCTGHLTPRKKTLYLLYTRLSGSQGWSGRVQEILSHWDLNAEPSSHSELLYQLHYTGHLH